MSTLGKPAHPSVSLAQKASCLVGGAGRGVLVGRSAVSPTWVPVEGEEVKSGWENIQYKKNTWWEFSILRLPLGLFKMLPFKPQDSLEWSRQGMPNPFHR